MSTAEHGEGATASLSPVMPDEVERLARDVLGRAAAVEASLATAESCTGGLLASVLTDVKDLSGVFERGFVVYSPPSKTELLGVDPDLIDQEGAVSRSVAIAMAEGAREASRAQVAVSVTGFADEGEEPGLVHLACATEGAATEHRVAHFGPIGRGPVRVASIRIALELLATALDGVDAASTDDED